MESITKEMLEDAKKCRAGMECAKCAMLKIREQGNSPFACTEAYAKQLLSETDKSKSDVWRNAPEWATVADVGYHSYGDSRAVLATFTRELPKYRIDEIAEEVVMHYHGSNKDELLADLVKTAILKDRKERGEK